MNKLKILFIAVCCLVSVLWSGAQSMDPPQRQNDEPARNHQTELLPAGSIMAFAGEVVPHGWLICDGKDYSNQEYPELYEVIQMKYVPSGSWIIEANNRSKIEKHFCVPDLRGRVIVGVDGGVGRVTANNTLGASSGEERHQLTIAELASHPHKMFDAISGSRALPTTAVLSGTNPNLACFGFTESEGGDQPHNNMQPYLVLNYIINTGKTNGQRNEIIQLKQKISQLEISQQGCAKAWVVFNGSNPNTLNSYGVSSVVRNSVGNYTINFLTPFSSSDYCSSLSPTRADCALLACTDHQTQQSFVFNTFKILGWGSVDPVRVSACFYGNQ